jgi:hypothetical protein
MSACFHHDDRFIGAHSAARILDCSRDTAIRLGKQAGIAMQMRPGSPWKFPAAAVKMLKVHDFTALEAFIAGDRTSELVIRYFGGSTILTRT